MDLIARAAVVASTLVAVWAVVQLQIATRVEAGVTEQRGSAERAGARIRGVLLSLSPAPERASRHDRHHHGRGCGNRQKPAETHGVKAHAVGTSGTRM